MSPLQFLALLLALSTAANMAFTVGLLARRCGATNNEALRAGAGAAATALGIYFTALAAYK
ncbi:hypothetical protein N4G69_47170 [Streptomyces mirabilis]|uniref:hypothetical protein n=1 Tax=Streptomyces mirabilis TaxID=68239 RepID=UPI0021C1F1FB|nr:hypothetical protein [Streptomyces mirabilis]MCT9113023.1 hypothetical protein [Streptomyces mirabilis]